MPAEMRVAAPPSTGMATNQVTVTSGGIVVLAGNGLRQGAIITNAGSATAYLGPTSGVTISTGLPLQPNIALNVNNPLYTGPVYAVTSGAAVTTLGTAEFIP